MQSICFVTATYGRDIEQFAILRESLRRFAPDYHHLAVVHNEDFSQFRDRFGRQPGLELRKTSDVLPSSIERRRRKSTRPWAKTLTRLLYGRWYSGWHFQQLTKMHVLAALDYDAAAFIDSDVFLCRPIRSDYFFVGDELKLFRRRAVTAEQLGFDISTHAILRNSLHEITEFYDYVFQPACFRKTTGISLLKRLRARSAWVYRFLIENLASEYNLLGYAATALEKGVGYRLVECNPEDLVLQVRYAKDRERLAQEIAALAGRPRDFVWIQSRLRVDAGTIRSVFESVATAGAGAVGTARTQRVTPVTRV
jgi:hypothetical protein